ncbi:MAG: response regulator [Coleofasciculus sp. S288]|nr:response regulator [Coleofasciculus sp. S288]
MSQDKELEIQLQFLEEAQEYLDTIESVLLGLSDSRIDSQQMDAVLRAAHSVKGGAGMMGFQTLSQLAHRLEDSFKVMKAQRNSLEIDGELERLLLSAVDRLRYVLEHSRQRVEVAPEWIDTEATPVFDKLRDRLGDPVADDASTMLGAEDGTNVAALLFETEVEGCLNRLESVLADPQAPCLEEELSIMAQELGGLGEMLQLPAFTQLCESVLQHLEAAPDRLMEIAKSALDSWRRSQALVLVGQMSSMPTQINLPGVAAAPVELERELSWEQEVVADISAFEWEPAALDLETVEFVPHTLEPEFVEAVEESPQQEVFAAEFEIYTPTSEPQHQVVTEDEVFEQPVTLSHQAERVELEEELEPASISRAVPTRRSDVQTTDFKWKEEKPLSAASATTKETQENTVRIPVRQLDRINDLFGELTIERNGLSLTLGRLRSLIETLGRRVSALEQSNVRLRTAYDTVATQSGGRAVAASLSGGSAHSPLKGYTSYPRSENAYGHNSGLPLQGFKGGNGDSHLSYNSRFDALEMDRYSDIHLLSMEVMETIVQIQEVTSDIGLSLEDTDQTARELNQTAKQLQTNLTRLRMRPLSDLVGRYSRALRDLSLQYGKLVELKVYGKGTLIDRSILEALSDPLMHLVRNAFDHGIEDPATRTAQGKPSQGVIEIKAAHRGNQTIITISDDGNGINLNKIRARAEEMGLDAELLAAASEDELLSLIFEPGFSTAERVTDLSGRGVGMDVVRNNLKQIRGDIRVDTQPGRGTTFTLTVPFTLSVARVLLVESNGMQLAFPTDVIEEMLLLHPDLVLTTAGSEVLKWEGTMVPLIRLGNWLTFYCPRRVQTPEGVPSINEPTVLMIGQGDQLVGLVVDRCWGEREVAIRQVEGSLAMPQGFASCTILGDGRVVPLVDSASMVRWITSSGRSSRAEDERTTSIVDCSAQSPLSYSSAASIDKPPELAIPQIHKDSILVVDDSINVRRFLALALEKAGYLVEQAKDGQDAVEKLLGGLQVSAVICDIEMPRLDGYGFLARIKSDPAFCDLPIAMLTSRTGDKHRQLAMTLGASAYFSKPYNERELLGTMRKLITESQARIPIPSGIL